MIETNARTNVFEVTFLPKGGSEPIMVRLPEDQFESKDADDITDEILDEYWKRGEPTSVIYIGASGTPINLWGNRRYG